MKLQQLEIEERLERIEQLLLSKKKVMTLEDAASYSGLKKSFLYKLSAKNILPISKPLGKVIFIDKDRFDEFLLSNPSKTQQEIEQEAMSYIAKKA